MTLPSVDNGEHLMITMTFPRLGRRAAPLATLCTLGALACADAADPSRDEGSDESSTPLVVSEAARAQAEQLTAGFQNVRVSRDERGASVDFDDASGRHHSYDFDLGVNLEILPEELDATTTGTPQPELGTGAFAYTSEWHWWGVKYRLNRGETRDLVTEGNNAAVLYAVGAAFGCGACAVGAAIEANWAGQANRFYNEGDCIHINLPYFTTGRTRRNTHNCR
jgi:hypothetical protein